MQHEKQPTAAGKEIETDERKTALLAGPTNGAWLRTRRFGRPVVPEDWTTVNG
jgi:hypothetical protein